MKIVIDASVALKWVIPEPDSDAAHLLRADELIAPSLLLIEAGNALWRLVRLGQITADQALRRFTDLSNAPVAMIAPEPHLADALKLAVEIGHPIYDCVYLAVALDRDTYVVTADGRFAAAASAVPRLAGRVRLLGSS